MSRGSAEQSFGNMVEQTLQQTQQLKQEQVITHQQIQSLEILQAPLLELQAKITQELAQNPVLEQESPLGDELLAENDSDEDSSERNKQDGGDQDEKLAELVQLAESWQNYLPPSHSFRPATPDDDEKRKHYYDSITEELSLQEQLLEQLRFLECDPKTEELAELIIGSIDERGYLRSNLKDLATVGMVSVQEMEKALKIVHGFEPPGIGARDLKECLLLQLRAKGRKNSKAAEIVEHYLDELGSNKLPFVARKVGVSMDKLEKILAEIRSLNPYPGSLCCLPKVRYLSYQSSWWRKRVRNTLSSPKTTLFPGSEYRKSISRCWRIPAFLPMPRNT